MKAFDLLPTEENILMTLQEDLLERNKDIWYFVDLLDNIDNSCSIALDGRWGSGKTFFCKHVKLWLDVNNDFIDKIEGKEEIKEVFRRRPKKKIKPYVTVYYDAWINDNDVDPILSLIYTIIKDADDKKNYGKNTDVLKIAGEIVGLFTGRNANGLYEALQGEDILQKIREQKNEQDKIVEFLNSLLLERGERLVIFIDELDRCKPSFAVQLLERIKHYFSNDRITFVFATNLLELQHTIKRLYGEGFDANLYLDRFFDFRITLPKANISKFYNKLGLDCQNVFEYVCKKIIRDYDFELREISKFYNQAKLVGYNLLHVEQVRVTPQRESMELGVLLFVPLMIGLRIKDIVKFNEFRMGKNVAPLIDLFKDREVIKHYLSGLLDDNETYDKKNAEKVKIVNIEDKLNEIYIFLFNNSDDYRKEEKIGKYIFNISMRNFIENTINGLTDNNHYSG